MQKGFSLFEVLITLAIISVGLLGFADAELQALRQAQTAKLYTILTQQIISLQDELQTAKQPDFVINAWQAQLNRELTDVVIQITPVSQNLLQIHLQWRQHNENIQLQQMLYLPAGI